MSKTILAFGIAYWFIILAAIDIAIFLDAITVTTDYIAVLLFIVIVFVVYFLGVGVIKLAGKDKDKFYV